MAMGHSDLRTTMGYYKLLPEHARSLLEDIGHTTSTLSIRTAGTPVEKIG
jgi:hypothetical protein